MDAVTLLAGDHNRVRGLFAQFNDAQENEDVDTMTALATRIFQELQIHTTIEEEIFYPAVRSSGNDELTELVAEGIEEHHVVDQLMEEMGTMEAGSEQWIAKMTVMIENVEHHADEEESDMFPKVRSSMSDLETLAQQLDARKGQLGAPTLAERIDLTKTELLELAKEQEIPGRSTMSQEELAAAVAPR
jgi:hemerythrin superfamily protein